MKEEVKQIMLEKLKEMAEYTRDDFSCEDDSACYNGLCSVMCDIATLLLKSETASELQNQIAELKEEFII